VRFPVEGELGDDVPNVHARRLALASVRLQQSPAKRETVALPPERDPVIGVAVISPPPQTGLLAKSA
jgi:hypothetical protein